MTLMSRAAYAQMIQEDLAWLDRQPDTLEAEHIRQIVKDSVRVYYDLEPQQAGLQARVKFTESFETVVGERDALAARLAALQAFCETWQRRCDRGYDPEEEPGTTEYCWESAAWSTPSRTP